MWLKRREQVGLGLISLIMTGKALFAMGLGLLFSAELQSLALRLILFGLLLDLVVKALWFRGIPKGSIKTIWEKFRGRLSYGLLCLVVTVKMTVSFGVGLWLGHSIPAAGGWVLIAASFIIAIPAIRRFFALK